MADPQVIVNLGTGGSDLNGQNGSTSSADSNDARFLDWPGDNAGNYVYLPGVAQNNLTVPDEAALDITGDIDLRVHVAVDALGANQVLMAKEQTSVQESWRFTLGSTGLLSLRFSATGTGGTGTGVSTVAAPVVAGEPIWLRVTFDVDNGASGRDFKFYSSTDGSTWSQVGATVTQAGATSINNSTSIVEVGSVRGGSANPATMKVYRAQVLDGIGGTTVLDIDTSAITSGSATSFAAATGQTVNLNRSTSGRKSVAVVSPVWLFGTDDRMEIPTDVRLNMPAGEDRTYLMMFRVWNNAIANAQFFAKFTGVTAPFFNMANNSTPTLAFTVNNGTTQVASTMTNPTSGQMEMRGFIRNTSTTQFDEVVDGVVNASNTDTLGSLEPSDEMQLMARAGAFYNSAELFAFMVFDRVLSDAEMTAIMNYYTSKVT